MKILITGGSGFIGSNLVRLLVKEKEYEILNLDKLTYAGNPESLADIEDDPLYTFLRADICNNAEISRVFDEFKPNAVMHLAAESHVDRSIDSPGQFIQTNVIGTYNLLHSALGYWKALPSEGKTTSVPTKSNFRFLHVSTDEVYGSLAPDAAGFSENTPYEPHSPYSASKASSDHLARAWHDTYKLPVLVTNCSNNYGPFQFPEKLIPVVILKCLKGESIPVYGSGRNVRDWLYVTDHAEALLTVLKKGKLGETYNIGGNNERQNIELVRMICRLVEELAPATNCKLPISNCESLITFVTDRPGHDMRYSIDASKIKNTLDWEPKENFESGFRKTVKWYLENQDWWKNILSRNHNLERIGKA